MFSGISQRFWINLLGFQLAWWCAILLREDGLLIMALLLLTHLLLHRQPGQELKAILLCGFTGFAIDLILTRMGLFIFPEGHWPPVWLLCLWFCFSATLRQSLSYFREHALLASGCGAVAGSLTYLAAARLGAVTFGVSELAMFGMLLVIWMVLFPLLLKLSHSEIREVWGDAH